LNHLLFWKPVYSRKDWEEAIRKAYGDRRGLLACMSPNFGEGEIPEFGQGPRYTKEPTLGIWALENGVDLSE